METGNHKIILHASKNYSDKENLAKELAKKQGGVEHILQYSTADQYEVQYRKQIRDYYREKRGSLPPELVKRCSEQISRTILQWDVYQQAEALFFYYPLGNEVSLIPLIEEALAAGRLAAFPKVEDGRMQFYNITSLDELAEGCFHVMEPQPSGRSPADWTNALCFVPGTVFDRAGGRFGYGRGYYDRFFSDRKGCRLAGCAYECQIAETLPTAAWDQRMDYLVSENGIFEIKNEVKHVRND